MPVRPVKYSKMSGSHKPPAQRGRFAELFNRLLETHLSPDGDPYLLREISQGTGGALSPAYLSLLRRGGIAMPPADKVQALAAFFGVDVSYFTGKPMSPPSGHDDTDEVLRTLATQPLVREMALRVGELGEDEQAVMLQLIDNARHLMQLHRQPTSDSEAPGIAPGEP
jgi:hypothetical protein